MTEVLMLLLLLDANARLSLNNNANFINITLSMQKNLRNFSSLWITPLTICFHQGTASKTPPDLMSWQYLGS